MSFKSPNHICNEIHCTLGGKCPLLSIRRFLFLALIMSALSAGSALPDTWNLLPDGTGDAPNLRAAVDSALSGDTLSLGNGLFDGFWNRNVNFQGKVLCVRSESGNPDSCIIDCDGEGRAFIIPHINGAGGVLEGITIQNGLGSSGGGAMILEEGIGRDRTVIAMEFIIRDCLFLSNKGNGDGGAIRAVSDVDLIIENSRFTGNENDMGWFSWVAGGAVSVKATGKFGSLNMKQCVVDSNRSDGPGGGLYSCNCSVILDSCEVSHNVSGIDSALTWSSGAGLHVNRNLITSSDMVVTITNSCFDSNIGIGDINNIAGDGGGVLTHGHDQYHMVDVHIADTIFRNNFAMQGGGLYVGRFSTGLVERCRFIENTAFLNGGGSYKGGLLIANFGEWARYEYCEFRGNQAGYDMSGIPAPVTARGGGVCNPSLAEGRVHELFLHQ